MNHESNDDIDPEFDPRTVEELINAALTEPEERAWRAIWALQYRGSKLVLDAAVTLCRSACPRERTVGADILAQLGSPERTFPKECTDALIAMMKKETHSGALGAVLLAFAHHQREDAIPVVLRHGCHPDPEVRLAVVQAIIGYENDAAIAALIRMTRDPAARVRDWATFGLGTQIDRDTPEIRDALAQKLEDSDADTRGEAMRGLAARGDRRVIPFILKELDSDEVPDLVFEAAGMIDSPEIASALAAQRMK